MPEDNMLSVVTRYDVSRLDALMGEAALIADTSAKEFVETRKEYIITHWSEEMPSAPGNSPAKDTGYLEESIKVQRRDDKGRFSNFANAVYWGLQVEAEYGAALESGYPPRNLAPRPFIAPAFYSGSKDFATMLVTNINFAVARRETGAKAEWMLSKL